MIHERNNLSFGSEKDNVKRMRSYRLRESICKMLAKTISLEKGLLYKIYNDLLKLSNIKMNNMAHLKMGQRP